MLLTGKAIIFETENEAKLWYETIKDFNKHSEISSAKSKMESWLRMNKEAPTE